MEIWKDIPGYEGYYRVSNKGNVKSLDRKIPNGLGRIGFRVMKGKNISPGKDSYGYLTFVLNKKGKAMTERIHRIVWISFNGKIPKNLVVDHIDSNPANNNLSNLRLISHRDNTSLGIQKKWKGKKLSKYPNVSYRTDRNKYFGRTMFKGKMKITGHFDNEIDAYNSVLKFKKKHNL